MTCGDPPRAIVYTGRQTQSHLLQIQCVTNGKLLAYALSVSEAEMGENVASASKPSGHRSSDERIRRLVVRCTFKGRIVLAQRHLQIYAEDQSVDEPMASRSSFYWRPAITQLP